MSRGQHRVNGRGMHRGSKRAVKSATSAASDAHDCTRHRVRACAWVCRCCTLEASSDTPRSWYMSSSFLVDWGPHRAFMRSMPG